MELRGARLQLAPPSMCPNPIGAPTLMLAGNTNVTNKMFWTPSLIKSCGASIEGDRSSSKGARALVLRASDQAVEADSVMQAAG